MGAVDRCWPWGSARHFFRARFLSGRRATTRTRAGTSNRARRTCSRATTRTRCANSRAAYALSKRPPLLLNIANVYERMGKLQEAVDALSKYLEEDPKSPERTTHETRIANLKKRIEAMPPPAPAPVATAPAASQRRRPPPPAPPPATAAPVRRRPLLHLRADPIARPLSSPSASAAPPRSERS